ncbi:hypothetical protein SAMN05216257_103301 [Meinhardsimonia xiamenensis]|jgi:hypothetical protein|uniref:Histidine kinase n=2 Tax=Meinhardsimonia xiamenensis TaxID=990712 RepID=A0A1G9D0K5_9RHOB|nr:hypothetical protein LV81_00453 [Meinhardsimonia xiamenensis]SDK57373.1 hypothetical protein SAMN05216257_103301 [Meinhardsimonia xiamenensis]
MLLVGPALVAGALMYWLQLYAFYEELDPASVELTLISRETGVPEPFPGTVIAAIDADSSPIRFRACARADIAPEALSAAFEPYPKPEPLNAPGWFDCFDAREIGEALKAGRARAFLSAPEIHDGVDRVIAVMEDGRAFAWQQLNEKYKD